MGKGKRWLAIFAGLSLIGGLGFMLWPRECDYSIDGRFSPSVWAHNLWARISQQGQDCDPWERVGEDASIDSILINYSIAATGGPSHTEFYIRPDGQGFVYNVDLLSDLDPLMEPEEALRKLADGRHAYSFTFADKALYAEVKGLLAPLRHSTGRLPDYMNSASNGVRGKAVIPCDLEGYHSAYLVAWSGSLNDFSDFSYFDNSSSYEDCLPLRLATARLRRVQDLLSARMPTDYRLRWLEEYRASTQN